MLTDSFFQQGVTHDICEDYALHGSDYVILSDGCSNGGGEKIQTDFGSRLLAKAAETYLYRLQSPSSEFPLNEIWNKACHVKNLINNLSEDCLTATLAMSYFHHDTNMFRSLLIGDGVMGGKRKDGSLEFDVYEFVPANRPFYMRYMFREGDMKAYLEMFGGKYRCTSYIVKDKELLMEEKTSDLSATEPYFYKEYMLADFEWSFIGTDGLCSFYEKVNTGTSKHNTPISVPQVLEVLFNELPFRTNFLQLQRRWAFKSNLTGSFQRLNWHNGDDVSIGIVRY